MGGGDSCVGGRGLGVGAVWARIGDLSRLSKGVKRWRGASRKNTFGISLTPPTGGSADKLHELASEVVQSGVATEIVLREPGQSRVNLKWNRRKADDVFRYKKRGLCPGSYPPRHAPTACSTMRLVRSSES